MPTNTPIVPSDEVTMREHVHGLFRAQERAHLEYRDAQAMLSGFAADSGLDHPLTVEWVEKYRAARAAWNDAYTAYMDAAAVERAAHEEAGLLRRREAVTEELMGRDQ